MSINNLSKQALEAGLDHIKASPADIGTLAMIVRRPATDAREVLHHGVLCIENGLEGDNWLARGSSRTEDRAAHPDTQINITNVRCVELVAGPRERWPLAGDQLYVDLDLSEANLPPGSRLQIGETELEITDQPHLGCKKFSARFGPDAMQFVNSELGQALHLRGLNARVIKGGTINTGDSVVKIS